MATEHQVREALEDVLVPGIRLSVIALNLVRNLFVDDNRVNVKLASAAIASETQKYLKEKAGETLKKLPGVKRVEVEFVESTPKDVNEVGSVIAIMSGKGGVGKSLVTGLTAVSLARKGYRVGVLDADITGPSIPRMFGMTVHPEFGDNGMMPVLSRSGIEIMSINLLLPAEDEAVIWRGPLIAKAVTQFWEEVLWGKLDYLVVDLPPGTADVPLTVMQSLPLSGVIIVFTPQDLTAMVVRKAVRMARQAMKIPILGVVENMGYFTIPETGKRLELFGKSKGEEMATAAGAPLLARLPIDSQLAQLCDEGDIERYDSELLSGYSEALLNVVSDRPKQGGE